MITSTTCHKYTFTIYVVSPLPASCFFEHLRHLECLITKPHSTDQPLPAVAPQECRICTLFSFHRYEREATVGRGFDRFVTPRMMSATSPHALPASHVGDVPPPPWTPYSSMFNISTEELEGQHGDVATAGRHQARDCPRRKCAIRICRRRSGRRWHRDRSRCRQHRDV